MLKAKPVGVKTKKHPPQYLKKGGPVKSGKAGVKTEKKPAKYL